MRSGALLRRRNEGDARSLQRQNEGDARSLQRRNEGDSPAPQKSVETNPSPAVFSAGTRATVQRRKNQPRRTLRPQSQRRNEGDARGPTPRKRASSRRGISTPPSERAGPAGVDVVERRAAERLQHRFGLELDPRRVRPRRVVEPGSGLLEPGGRRLRRAGRRQVLGPDAAVEVPDLHPARLRGRKRVAG